MSFCPHCHSGHDPVLVQSTWSCGVRYNDPSWRTKECYKRNLELANERIKRLEESGEAMYDFINPPSPCLRTSRIDNLLQSWDDAKIGKEAKP